MIPERRPNKREKMKRNKGFPYKSRVKPHPNTNLNEDYALVTKEGEIIEKFRLKTSCMYSKHKFEQIHYQELKIVFLPDFKIEKGKVILK